MSMSIMLNLLVYNISILFSRFFFFDLSKIHKWFCYFEFWVIKFGVLLFSFSNWNSIEWKKSNNNNSERQATIKLTNKPCYDIEHLLVSFSNRHSTHYTLHTFNTII